MLQCKKLFVIEFKIELKNWQSFYNFILPENKEFVGQGATMIYLGYFS